MKHYRVFADYGVRDIAFIVYFSSSQFDNLLTKLFGFSMGRTILTGGLFLLFLLSFYEDIKDNYGEGGVKFLLIFFFTQALFVLSYLFNPDLLPWYTHSNWGLQIRFYPMTSGFYALLVILLVSKPWRMLENLKLVVLIRFAHGILAYLNYLRQGGWVLIQNDGVTESLYNYNMSFGYSMAFVALFCFVFLYLKRNYFFGILGFIATTLSVLHGSRGVFIVYGVFAFLFFLQLDKSEKVKYSHFGLQFLLTLTTFFVYRFVEKNMIFLIPLFVSSGLFIYEYFSHSNINIKNILFLSQSLSLIILMILIFQHFSGGLADVSTGSRNIDKLLSLNLTDTNGRNLIWESSYNGIKQLFPFGNGVFGDRLYTDPRFLWGYSHNILLEMTLSFGILGLVFLVVLFYKSVKSLFDRKLVLEYRLLLLVFMSIASKLLVSDSFWYSMEFWGLIAIMILGQKFICIKGLKDAAYEAK